jgi:polysaccharide chain length determinant protein (PEP-CTERM system associated)
MNEVIRQGSVFALSAWRHRTLGLVVAWLCAIIGAIVVISIPDKYEASARIYVDTESILKPLMSGLAVQPNVEQQVMMLSRTLISRPNIEKLIRMADLDLSIKTKGAQDKLADQLMKSLEIKSTTRDNLYTLSYRDPDPNKSKRVIQSLTSIFVESSLGEKRQDSDSAKKFLDDQIVAYEKKLEEAEGRLKDFRVRNMDVATVDGRDVTGQLADSSAKLSQARADLHEAENGRDAIKRQILGGAGDGSAAKGSGVNTIAVPDLDKRIDDEKRNLDTLLQRYTEQHPDVIGARRVLKDLEQQRREKVAALRKAATSNPSVLLDDGSAGSQGLKASLVTSEANVATLSARVAEYEKRVDHLKLMLKGLPELDKEQAQLNRDYEVNKRNYEQLVARRESATMSGDLERAAGVADFRLIDPPRVSPEPVSPNRLLLLPAALLMALGCGVAMAFVAGQVRPVFFDGRALQEATGLPLLASISLITSPAQQKRERRNLFLFLVFSAALLGLYASGIFILWWHSHGGA